MSQANVTYSVFTKMWKIPTPELGEFVSGLGFTGVELPVRPEYQAQPETVARDLPEVAGILGDFGVKITSVAGPADEATIATCGEVGVPIIRTMVGIGPEGYVETEKKTQKEYEALLPLLEKHGVKIGLQNHCDACVCNAMGIMHLIEGFDPELVGAVWDAGHCALNGEDPELGLDICWSHLCMVNLKNAFWRRVTGPEAETIDWRPFWTTGRQGISSWPRVAAELKRRNYEGVITLCAEFEDIPSTDRLIAEDLAYAKSLFE